MSSNKKNLFRSAAKKLLTVLVAAVLCMFSSCTGPVDKPESSGSETSVDNGKKELLEFTADGELAASSVGKDFSVKMLSATDDFGREILPMGEKKTDKERYVGLFYFLWMGQHGGQQSEIYDVNNMLYEGEDALWDNATNLNSPSPVGQYHYWGEPLYGYYNSQDPWVIRRHVELLTLAGVDFLIFDATNAFEYFDVVNVILPILKEYQDAGWNVPKFMFYTNSSSKDVVRRLYEGYAQHDDNKPEIYNNGIYKDGRYESLWFAPNGKPLIAAITAANAGASDQSIANAVTDAELLNFFEFKESQWPNTGRPNDNGFPWVDFTRPQLQYGDTVNVSVAQHNLLPFSDAALSSSVNNRMWGRGYTTESGADHSQQAVYSGKNFEEQWKVAEEYDLKYTFVTGWNEWIALKQFGNPGSGLGNRAFFVDTFNTEFSRDVEMMKGGYFDNFYLQLARNTRQRKYTALIADYESGKEIDIAKGVSQWADVNNVYYDFAGEAIERDFAGFCSSVYYKDNSNRNDIEEIRVTSDADNVYFLVKCKNDIITDLESGNWMNLLINVDGNEQNCWYGYNYIVNRKIGSEGKTSLETFKTENGKVSFVSAGNAEIRYNGKYVQYKVSRSALGISGKEFRIGFKVSDNVSDITDMESYYTTGDTCPAGRLNYTYLAK